MNLTLPGLKKILLAPRPHTEAADVAATRARALFEASGAAGKRGGNLVEFLARVSLFEDLGRRDLARLARIVHERDYGDGEHICEEGRPGAALFIVRRGVVEVVRRGPGDRDVPIVLLEPPASFEEAAVTGIGPPRWFSVRARGPVSLVALGKSDLDALSIDFPVIANKVLTRLAGLLAARLSTLVDVAFLGESDEHAGSKQ
jgi:CRP/FNR family transcriptional regulator